MRATTVLAMILALKKTRIRGTEVGEEGLTLDVAPITRVPRCSGCLRRQRRVYDRRERTWRHLDLAGMRLDLRYPIRRVDCGRCGVTTELVPWAEADSRFTTEFEAATAYLAQRADQTTVSRLMRVSWEAVGRIAQRVVRRLGVLDRLDGLTHIGIDELSYRKHHRYVTVVIDHRRSRVVWCGEGKSAETLMKFFAELGPERAAKLQEVTIDMSEAYRQAVAAHAPNATLTFDRFHVQRLVHDALDEVRRAEVREVSDPEDRRALKKTRWALHKNPWNLTRREEAKIADVQRTNRRLYRGYLLKETLSEALYTPQEHVAERKLHDWIAWAVRSRLAPFARAARTIRDHLDGVMAYVRSGLSNGRAEGLNGKIRTITRRAYGFHSVRSLIGLIFLCCSGLTLNPVRHYPLRSAPTTT